MIFLIELLIVCAFLFQVGFHVRGAGANKTETILSEGLIGPIIDTQQKVVREEAPHTQGGDQGFCVYHVKTQILCL